MAGRLVRISPSARQWLLEEIAYLTGRSPGAAKKVAASLRAARELLAEHPGLAAKGDIPGTRRFIVAPYILTFRERAGVLEIAAIRHARQSDARAPREMRENDAPGEGEDRDPGQDHAT